MAGTSRLFRNQAAFRFDSDLTMKIAFANDHAGHSARAELLSALERLGHEVIDFGAFDTESVDYPDFAEKACREVAEGRADRAVLVCGTGQGMVIAANKMRGIRAARCLSVEDERLAASHNKANAIALPGGWGRETPGLEGSLSAIVEAWLDTPFEGGKHQRRIEKIADLEARASGEPLD